MITPKAVALRSHTYVCIDGLDGIGKSTQIALLQNHLQNKKIEVLSTRALGGPLGSEIEKLRTFLFQGNFSSEIEENIIELIARLNLSHISQEIIKFYRSHDRHIPFWILQDRGIISHFCYAKSKGHNRTETFERFLQVLQMSEKLNVKNIVLVPKDINMILERIKNRGHHNQFHDKYENFETQKKVYENIIYEIEKRDVGSGRKNITEYADFILIEVEDKDQPLDVHSTILEVLNL